MKDEIKKVIESLDKNIKPELNQYNIFIKSLDFNVDKDFIEFYKLYDGAEGFFSPTNYLKLWNINDIVALNPYYVEIEECNNLYFFGSNGSNLGFAFNKENGKIVSIDFLDISFVEPKFISNTFFSFLNNFSCYDLDEK